MEYNPEKNMVKIIADRITTAERNDRIDITTIQGNQNLSLLSQAVSEQNLEKYGMKIGDYFNGASGYTYTLADLNTFYGKTDEYSTLNTKHISIIADAHVNVPWKVNDEGTGIDDTSGGYAASNLHKYLQETALANIRTDIAALTGDSADRHLVKHQKMYSNTMVTTAAAKINDADTTIAVMSKGCPTFQGATSDWTWLADQYISALTEAQVYGHDTYASSARDTGEAYKQLAVFRKYCPNLIFRKNNGNLEWIWLRNAASAIHACYVSDRGTANYNTTHGSSGVAGLILFK